jgi:hypothetical protein
MKKSEKREKEIDQEVWEKLNPFSKIVLEAKGIKPKEIQNGKKAM